MIKHTTLTLSLIALSVSQAIAAPITSTINITSGQNVNLSNDVITKNQYGIEVNGENSSLIADGKSITTEGDDSLGIRVMNQGHAVFNNGAIHTDGVGSYGVSSENSGSSIRLDNVKLIVNGNNSYGALAATQGKLTAHNLSVTTTNRNSNGVSAINPNSSITLNHTTINTQGVASHGIYSAEKGASINSTDLIVHTQGAFAVGINQTSQSQGDFNNSAITTEGKHSAGINISSGAKTALNNITIDTYGDHSNAIQLNSAQLSITQHDINNKIQTQGSNANVIDFAGNSVVNIKNSHLIGSGNNNHVYFAHQGASIINSSNNIISSTGTLIHAIGGSNIINMQDDQAMNVSGGLMDVHSVSPNNRTSVILNADQKTQLAGDIRSDNDSITTLHLNNQSTFSGNIQNLTTANIMGNSQLLLDGNSNITDTHLDHSNLVFMQNDSDYPTLQTQALSGNGSLFFNTILGNDQSKTSKIVAENISGDYKIYVHNQGGQGAYTHGDGINIIQANHENTARYALAAPVYAGVYEYLLHRHGNNVYLQNEIPAKSTTSNTKPTLPIKPPLTPPITPPESNSHSGQAPSYRPAIPGYLLATYLDQSYGYLSIGTLHERTGNTVEPHIITSNTQRMWSRAFTNKTQTNNYRFDFTSYTNFYQIGYDLKHDSDAAEPVYAGVTFEVGHAHNKTYDEKRIDGQFTGRVNVDAIGIGIGGYYTRYLSHNDYIDIVGKGIRYKNNYSAKAENSLTQHASSLLLSVEYGKDFPFYQHFHIEPQAQAIYQFNHANSINSSDLNIPKANTQTGQLRLGSAFYSDTININKNMSYRPYFSANYIQKMNNNAQLVTDSDGLKQNMASNYWQVGAGLDGNIGTHTHVYTKVRYQQTFNDKESQYSAMVGLSFTW
ncbi:MAG: autotransporter outer membrane beta-barrel domain-containing protein [Plesiomonas sp.]|uniref:autotransporter family protein n=1 Tax=Plesiomonas sp. TaxID=2486279 RepID=UPI003F2C06C2